MEDVKRVIKHPLLFKNKLGIGAAAYRSLQQKETGEAILRVLNIATAGGAGAAIASLLAPAGILVTLGLAASPVGWIIAAGVASSAGVFGISQILRGGREERLRVITTWTNTPLDVLAVALFNFFAPLGIKVATLDGSMTDPERRLITEYFVYEWGYSERFIQLALPKLESNVDTFPIVELVDDLIEYNKLSPDCDYDALSKELTGFLQEVTRADGELHDLEVIFIQWLEISLAHGKPGFWNGLISKVRFGRGSKKETQGNDESDSTLIGRYFPSALRWARDQI